MLSVLEQTVCLPSGVQLTFMPGQLTQEGRMWHILAAGRDFTVDLPIYNPDHTIDHRGSRYGLSAQARLATTRIAQRLVRVPEMKDVSDAELVHASDYGPDQWGPNDYDFESGGVALAKALWSILNMAFKPGLPAKPQWIAERVQRLFRKDGGVLFRMDERKPMDWQIYQNVLLMRDEWHVRQWMAEHGAQYFTRSDAWLGKVDFLATQDSGSMFKGFLVEGVRINSQGRLEGQGQPQIGLSWHTPFGNMVDPVRVIISRGNRSEGLRTFVAERPVVDWHPDPKGLELTPGHAHDGQPSELPGLNALTALVTWPRWLNKDCIIVSRSLAERGVHYIPHGFSFWAQDGWHWVNPEGERRDGPPEGVVLPDQLIAIDGDGQGIHAPTDLLPNSIIDWDTSRVITTRVQDTERPIINFSAAQDMHAGLRRSVDSREQQLSAWEFIMSRGLDDDILDAESCCEVAQRGYWQVLALPSQRLLRDDEKLIGIGAVQARPYCLEHRVNLMFQSATPLATGCKLSTRTGAYKGVIRVIDDAFMPVVVQPDGTRRVLEMLVAKENVPNRCAGLVAELALGAYAEAQQCTARVGREVSPQDVAHLVGPYGLESQLEWPNWRVRWQAAPDTFVEGRLLLDVAQVGECTEYAVATDSGLMSVLSADLEVDAEGEFFTKGEPMPYHAMVGPLFVLIQNRHPDLVSGWRTRARRDSSGLLSRGNGAVAIGLNETQTMLSLGLPQTAAYFAYHDSQSAQKAREIAESLVGPLYTRKDASMTELEQVLQKHGVSVEDLAMLSPGFVEDLAAATTGMANARRLDLVSAEPNNHWQLSVLGQMQVDASLGLNEPQVRSDLAQCLRYGLWLSEDSPWQLVNELEAQDGGTVMYMQYMFNQQPAAQVMIHKQVRPFDGSLPEGSDDELVEIDDLLANA